MASICIVTEQLPPAFAWDPAFPVRGTEKFYVQTAENLAEFGHNVTVFYDGADKKLKAEYKNRRDVALKTFDAALVCNRRSVGMAHKMTKNVVEWTNFYPWMDFGSDDEPLIVISEIAKKTLPLTKRPVHVIGHGVDPSVFHKPAPDAAPRQKIVLYTSSPDRGLQRLEKLWRAYDVENTYGYKLVATSYGTTRLSDHDVADFLRSASFWVHPGAGVELYCLAAVEAQACGATPIVVPNGALRETVLHGYRFTNEAFDAGLVGILAGDATMDGIDGSWIPTWAEVTREIERVLLAKQ